MPRHSTKHDSAVYSQYSSSSQYLSDSSQSPSPPSHSLTQPAQSAPQSGSKKKHVCSTCDRGFTTSGHLARHLRVHTGERNHKCPFPGCETRCSRQDNLQQHYRIHLSPGSRRSSSSATRAAIARAVGANGSKNSRSSSAIVTPERVPSDTPSPPPALEQAMIPPPPDSPPPLVHAFPVAQLPVYNDNVHSASSSSRSSTPLENTYPMISPHSQGLTNGHIASQSSPLASHYSDSPPNYTESSQHSNYGYVSPTSHAPPTSAVDQPYEFSYSDKSPLPRIQPSTLHHASIDNMHDHSPPSSAHLSSVSSRLSISHISHPQSYPNHYHAVSSPSPDSCHSVSPHSQTSGPPTPNYSAYQDDRHDGTTYHTIESIPDPSALANSYVSPHNHIIHGNYHHSMMQQQSLPRYDSPPPILAPIQDERVIRGDIRLSHVQHSPVSTPLSSSYIHSSIHSYPYHATHLPLNQTWKHDALLRGRS
ncbi:hypothetical protein EV363DRAFT_1209076 [Boletus edulis]|uniref:C2H2-type domain-containing protein n=1 Tax=Boletus edulis BED1 TaxID=1328754 RepID=A0AAD4BK90_BOLED|nr:hypothetical protein EV363DRAFT_1209076 [Boletus edulis]KAF8432977.1 hypothetical protein L210DRAFT_3455204 [Boletus edulis BED1]